MISLDNLTVSYGGWTLFDNISFLINPKDRVGLVGKNGAGKTTLLRIITGEQQPTSGAVTINGECTIGYLPQTMRVADTTTLVEETAKAFDEVLRLEAEIESLTREIAERTDYESADYEQLLHRLNDAQDRYHILGGETRDADIEKTLLGLGFKREDFGRATSEFSGGWRMRIELAKLLLRRPSIFLLDEPTNHLDIESIQWLEEYLKNYNGAVLLISHDRAFLDNVTNRTVELSLGKITDYKVPYSKYVVLRAERRAQQLAAYENQQRMIEKTEEFIEKFRYKPTKSNQVQSRIKQLERLERLEVEEEDLATLNIKFPPAPRSGQIVAEINEAGMSFGAKHVFSGANFTIEKGDRIAFVGRNGEGKTTLARMLVGQLTPTEGSIRIGANVNIGYYAQNQDDLMDGEFTVYDTLDRVAVGDIRTRLRDILGAFLFRGEDIDKKVKVLSGGERARLAMARMMLEPRNLLVLDEPTNHLDTEMVAWLEDWLRRYKGGLVMVTHDRYFLERVVNHITELSRGKLYHYEANYSRYLELREQRAQMAEASERKRQSILRVEREWILRGCQARSTKSKERIDRYEALKNQKAPERDSTVQLAAASSRLGKKIITLEHVSKGYDGRTLFADFSYGVLRTDRIGIVGRNGAGKSTLLRLLAGEIQPDSGTVELGETVRIGHFSQEGRELDLNQRVYDCIHEVAAQVKTDEGTFSAKTMLERFLFTPDLQQTTIGRLSGGERRRLYLLSVLMAAPNVLLLDEPTNDLDVTTLSILEDYLQSFPGPIITVSHDRFFLDKMADTILEVRPEGRVDIFTGNWSDWARKRRPAEEKKPEKSEKTEKPQPERPREKKLKFSYNEQREFETIDAVLAELEEKLAACRRAQEACGSDYVRLQELTDEQERLSAELDEKTERWVYLNDLKEKIDAQNSQG